MSPGGVRRTALRGRGFVWRLLKTSGHWIGVTGCLLAGVPAAWRPPTPRGSRSAGLLGPVPGHPEQLVPDLRPTPAEREIWSRLGDLASWPH